MEVEQLRPFVLLIIFTGLLLGAGVLTLDKFRTSVRVATTVTDETVAVASGAGTLTNNPVTSVTGFFYNHTNKGMNYTLTTANWTSGGVLSLGVPDEDYNITYVYSADSVTSDAMENMVNAIGDIPELWLALIITVFVLAIIMTMVIRTFGGPRGR